ncbi:hypothetical protein BKA83DRAFT_4125831 [Pisolithus microcarpus]|nr:hypothetical protein BKA83DRAFT_4130695 [Pisolithus microcarpus]KAI6023182.1 hypothetical protein BKA83DRAFT_4125831 [Pisolithus microcarpus]
MEEILTTLVECFKGMSFLGSHGCMQFWISYFIDHPGDTPRKLAGNNNAMDSTHGEFTSLACLCTACANGHFGLIDLHCLIVPIIYSQPQVCTTPNNSDMSSSEAAVALPHSTETVETEMITEETTTTTVTSSGMEMVNVTVRKLCTCTMKVMETTPQQPNLLLSSPHIYNHSTAPSQASGKNPASISSATPTHVQAVVTQMPSYSSATLQLIF